MSTVHVPPPVSALRDLSRRQRTVIVAMIAMRMMEVAADAVIDMVGVRKRLVAAAGTMDMTGVLAAAAMVRRAAVGVAAENVPLRLPPDRQASDLVGAWRAPAVAPR
jgi:hypothetical protein